MAINPYTKFLGDRDAMEQAHDTPATLRQLVSKLGPEGMKRSYGPGKWTAAQILCHLADVEIAWGFRLRQALTQEHHTIQPFEQDDWARCYDEVDASLAFPAFAALRAWNLAFLETVPVEEFSRPVTHPERGTMTVKQMLDTLAGHDRNHLAQLETIAGEF
jgi:uncharacterized damage-inducible protein DinB